MTPDLALAAQIAGGDESAFSRLVELHHAAMVRLALSFVRTRALADKVVQDAWMGVLEGIGRFEGRSSLKTWILGIVVKRALTKGAREGRQIPLSALAGAEDADDGNPDAGRFGASG